MAYNKLLVSLLILFLSFSFQHGTKVLFGWSPDFALGVLVSLSFFLGVTELLFAALAGALLLNWQPYIGPELALLMILPLFAAGIREHLPWRAEINHLLSVFFALAVFYGISSYGSLFLENPVLFLKSAGWTLLFSAFVFQILNYFYPISRRFGARHLR